MNVLKIKKLKENAIIPKRATEGSAGMDLYACIDSSVVINPGDLVTIPTGIAIQLSSGDKKWTWYQTRYLSVKRCWCCG